MMNKAKWYSVETPRYTEWFEHYEQAKRFFDGLPYHERINGYILPQFTEWRN